MLHHIADIFSIEVVVLATVIALVCFGVNETLADGALTKLPQTHFLEDHAGIIAGRPLALPSYWIWFDGDDLIEYLKSFGRVDLYPLIVLCLFNAAVNTWVVASWLVAVSLWLGRRVVPVGHPLLCVWIVAMLAMVADLTEDMAMFVVVLNYPVTDYPFLREMVAYSSTIKFGLWLVVGLWDVGFIVRWVLRPLKQVVEGRKTK